MQLTITSLDNQTQHILWPFFYFDIFAYPLRVDEIILFSPLKNLTKDKVQSVINALVAEKTLFDFGGYYALQNRPDWLSQRLDQEQLASKTWPAAHRYARLIYAFPFVRAVFISGSFSKNIMTPDGDVDYFIITHPGRLWLARTLLILFKKIFLLNSRKYFCLNYFVDSQHLSIEDQNIFSATELITLLPMAGQYWHKELWETNRWVNRYYPNFPKKSATFLDQKSSGGIKNFVEKIFARSAGNQLDKICMQITVNHWKHRFKHLDQTKFEQLFKSAPHISTHHPHDFQTKALDAFRQRVTDFENRFRVKFDAIGY